MEIDYRAIKSLAAAKEKELQELNEKSMRALEEQLELKNAELQDLRCLFEQLKKDFKYNLQLLHERDSELEQQDRILSELRVTSDKQSGEISELSVKLEQLKDVLSQETLAKREVSSGLLKRLDLLHAQHEAELRIKDVELAREKEEHAKLRRELERQLALAQEELQSERHATARRVDELARQLQRDREIEKEEADCSVLSLQLQVKMLTKELEVASELRARDEHDKQAISAAFEESKKRVKDLEWLLEDSRAELAFSVKSLQTSLRNAEIQFELQRDDMNKKFSDLSAKNSEKASMISNLKQACDASESELQARLCEVSQKLLISDTRLKDVQSSSECLIKEKDGELHCLKEQVNQLKAAHTEALDRLRQADASSKTDLQELQEANAMLLKDAENRKHDIERYRKDLMAAVDRVSQLERDKAQMNIDYHKQTQALERSRIHEMEQLVASLTKAKDDALAKVKHQEQQLSSLRSIVDSRSLQDFNKGRTSDDLTTVNATVREQNESLRLVIRQMRQEMEALVNEVDKSRSKTDDLLLPKTSEPVGQPTDEYTKTLEEEIKQLKAANRRLQLLSSSLSTHVESEGTNSKDGTSILHLQALNETIGQLRNEKVALQAQARKMQIRVDTLTAELDKARQEPAKKQIIVEQLQYELHALERRQSAEIGSLRQRTTSLELQLSETQHEADEYYKSMLEKNAQLTALESQLSEMKVAENDQTAVARQVNYGAQELVIQQLQDEVTRLRTCLADRISTEAPRTTADAFLIDPQAEKGGEISSELAAAKRQIAQLSKEKAVLTELSNKLRAELKRTGGGTATVPARSGMFQVAAMTAAEKSHFVHNALRPRDVASRTDDRLRMMENLQYQQTMSELSRSPRRKDPEPWLSMAEQLTDTSNDLRKKSQPISPPLAMIPERDTQQPAKLASVVYDRSQDAPGSTNYNTQEVASRSEADSRRQPETPRERSPSYSMSSVDGGGSSMQDIWRILDESNSFADTPGISKVSGLEGTSRTLESTAISTRAVPTLVAEHAVIPENPVTLGDKHDAGREFFISGSKNAAGVRRQMPTEANATISQRPQNAGTVRQKKAPPSKGKFKIRNYNIKD